MRIFSNRPLRNFLLTRIDSAIGSIKTENDTYILGVGERSYLEHHLSEVRIEPICFDVDALYVSQSEKSIPAERYPSNFSVRAGESYMRQVFTFHIPYEGDQELFSCVPSQRLVWSEEVTVSGDEVLFEIVAFSDTPDEIHREKDSVIDFLEKQSANIKKEVDSFNQSIENKLQAAIEQRKQQVLKSSNLLSSLGLPIKKTAKLPKTFDVSPTKKTTPVLVRRPTVVQAAYTPEPTISDEAYEDILVKCHEVGLMFERLPSTYSGKEEEHLRDYYLMFLETNFEGSSTGETFNKSGKTDILIRHEGVNVFIAECKFWSGQKGFLEAISQLLGYLTWRDSKAAIIMFVRNKEISPVLETVAENIQNHPNYVAQVSESADGWTNHIFHLNNDEGREVKVAVQLVHIPSTVGA